ncbi:MAG TPA: hypothetical protein VGD67_20805 [Pseudonocardiaceae bacterium]
MSWRTVLRRVFGGNELPPGFDGEPDAEERVLGAAAVAGGGHLVATQLGLWVPFDGPAGGTTHRRISWHLISKATWDGRGFTVVEADEVGTEDGATLIADRAPCRYPVPEPGRLPETVHARVTRSVVHSEQAPGGGLRVQRRVPGRDGIHVQLRRPRP